MSTRIPVANAPSNEYNIIDNGAAPAANTVSFDQAPISYDTLSTGGATAQGTNPSGRNGSVLLDSTNDYTPAMYRSAANLQTTSSISTVLNSPLTNRLLFKNPA